MRWASYRDGDSVAYGLVHGDGLVEASVAGAGAPLTLREAIAAGLEALGAELERHAPTLALDELTYAPLVPDPGKIVCVGLNYRAHRDESSRPPTDHPTVFLRLADTQIGHGETARIPRVSRQLDYEGELAVVIGRSCFDIEPADARAVIAGYSCYDDFSVRDWQRQTSQWTPGKNFPATGAFGPHLVGREEVSELASRSLVTEVNGEVRQQAVLADMIWPVDELISHVSRFTTLGPGDVVVTGTPAGVGSFHDPPAWLREGDTVTVRIEGIGELRNPVAPANGS